jgi:hypothetical protein
MRIGFPFWPAYKSLRAASSQNGNPILISERATISTSKQAQEYLLCEDCEQRFRKNGEDWTLANCFRGPGEFKISQSLLATTALYADADMQLYKANDVANLDLKSIVYFGMSVFWRAAVRSWRIPGAPPFGIKPRPI